MNKILIWTNWWIKKSYTLCISFIICLIKQNLKRTKLARILSYIIFWHEFESFLWEDNLIIVEVDIIRKKTAMSSVFKMNHPSAWTFYHLSPKQVPWKLFTFAKIKNCLLYQIVNLGLKRMNADSCFAELDCLIQNIYFYFQSYLCFK